MYKAKSFSARAKSRVAAYTSASGSRARITAAGRGLLRTGGNAPFVRGRRTGRRPARELKYVDVNWGNVTVPTLCTNRGSLAALVSQGTGENQRIGRKFTIRSFSLRGEITMPNQNNGWGTGSAYPQTDVCRLVVVQDKQCNGAAQQWTDIFQINNSGSAADWRAYRNMDNIDRFKILLDKTFQVQNQNFPNGSGSAAGNIVPYNIYRKCYIPIEAAGTTADVANLRSNNLSVFVISSQGICLHNGMARIRFSDEG